MKKRPNDTWVRVSMSSQTVNTGDSKQFVLLPAITPVGESKPLDLAFREVMICNMIGQITWVPNLRERDFSAGDVFESMAAYAGLGMRNESDTDVSKDLFTYPDYPWLWRGTQKQVYQVTRGTNKIAYANTLQPGGIQGGWTFNKKVAWVLDPRRRLVLSANYTDDGAVDNSTWWVQFYFKVCW